MAIGGDNPLSVAPNDGQPSISEQLRSLLEDSVYLFRTEIRLAKAELRGNITAAKNGAVAIGIGVFLLLAAVFTLVGAAVGFLTPYVGAGWAALIVAVVVGVFGVILVVSGGKKLSATSLAPDRAVASLKQDAEVIKGNL